MSTMYNNNFSRDNNNTRSDRLFKIQQFFPEIATELNAPSQLVDWAMDCSQKYEDLYSSFMDYSTITESATYSVQLLTEKLEKEYQLARSLVVSTERNNATLMKDFMFDTQFPRKRAEKIQRVERILETNQHYIDMEMGEVIPEIILNRISAVLIELNEEMKRLEKLKIELNQKSEQTKERFKHDSVMLGQLFSWFKLIFGKDDYRFSALGMVKPKKTRRGKQILPPENLTYDSSSKEFKWEEVERATSYELVAKIANSTSDFDTIYQGNALSAIFPNKSGTYLAKIRARNKYGFGDWSEEIEFNV